jgi:basic membrane protein A
MKFSLILEVTVAVFFSVTTVSGAMSLDDPPKPVFLYAGPKDDAGWHQSIDQARTKLEPVLHVTIPYAESVAEADIKNSTENFINQGRNIVIGDSPRYSAAFADLAEKYPKIAFINIANDIVSAPRAPNLISAYGRSYESQYLCGVVAGMTTKSKNIGFVAPQSSPVVNWEINGYTLGVRNANPDATVHVVFVDDANPANERKASLALIDRGADVIGQSVDGPTPQIVAQERGVFATGHGVDLHELAPNSALCASIWVWDRYLSKEIEYIAAANWKADANSLLGIRRGAVDVACCSTAITQVTMAKLIGERDGITISGHQVFAGPLVDGDNRERVPPGDVLGDDGLWAMDWFVKGVVIDTIGDE